MLCVHMYTCVCIYIDIDISNMYITYKPKEAVGYNSLWWELFTYILDTLQSVHKAFILQTEQKRWLFRKRLL